jgi:hypothetical protein
MANQRLYKPVRVVTAIPSTHAFRKIVLSTMTPRAVLAAMETENAHQALALSAVQKKHAEWITGALPEIH